VTRLAKLLLFASSFSPLLFLLAVRYLDRGWLPVVLGVGGGVLAVAGLGLLRLADGGQVDTYVIDDVEGRSESLTGYLVGYLFPFLVLDPGDSLTVLSSALFLALLALIYVEGNLLYLNPLLVIQGRQIFAAAVHRLDDPDDRRNLVLIADTPFLRTGHWVAGDVRLATRVAPDD
jgi:hypothetical protein